MYIFIWRSAAAQRLKSWQRLQNGARCRWTTNLSLVHPLKFHHQQGPHVRQSHFPPRIVRHDTEESVKTEGSLGEKYFFGGKEIVTSNQESLTCTTGSLWEGEGNGNNQNSMIPVTVPGSIPRNYGTRVLPDIGCVCVCVFCFVLLTRYWGIVTVTSLVLCMYRF